MCKSVETNEDEKSLEGTAVRKGAVKTPAHTLDIPLFKNTFSGGAAWDGTTDFVNLQILFFLFFFD